MDTIGIVVPADEGSERVTEPGLLPFAPHLSPLEWKLQQLADVLPPRQIFVGTSSHAARAIAARCGVRTVAEPRHGDHSSGNPRLPERITAFAREIPFPHLAWVDARLPLMAPADYQRAFQAYVDAVVFDHVHDSLFAAQLIRDHLWWADRPLNYQADRTHTPASQLPDVYRVTGGLFLRDRASILRDAYFLGPNPLKFLVGRLAATEIDLLEDLKSDRGLDGAYQPPSCRTVPALTHA